MPDLRLSTGTVLFVVLAMFVPAAHAAAPFQPGAHGFGHQKVCKSVPAHFARCHAEVIVDVGGEPLVTPAPDGLRVNRGVSYANGKLFRGSDGGQLVGLRGG